MRTSFIGLTVLLVFYHVSKAQGQADPTPWPEIYQFNCHMESLTNGFTENYSVSKLNHTINVFLSAARRYWPPYEGDRIVIHRRSKTTQRVIPSFKGETQQKEGMCYVTLERGDDLEDEYGLPDIRQDDEWSLNLTYKGDTGYRRERWVKSEFDERNNAEIKQTFVILYRGSKSPPHPYSREYKYIKGSGVVGKHTVYHYADYRPDKSMPAPPIPKECKAYPKPGRRDYGFTGTNSAHQDLNEKSLYNTRKRMVEKHNSGDAPYKLELNRFAYMTDRDAEIYFKCAYVEGPETVYEEHVSRTEGSIGRAFHLPQVNDWRFAGAVTPVKDQGRCGSCWAFSVAGAMESYQWRILKKQDNGSFEHPPVLSEQMLMDCVWNNARNGSGRECESCFGGSTRSALTYIKERGILKSKDYGPYLANGGLCMRSNFAADKFLKLKKFKRVKPTYLHLKESLRKYGPLVVIIDTPDSMMFYKSGIFELQEEVGAPYSEYGYAALMVGYGSLNDHPDASEGFFLIKTSLGEAWGEAGYIRIGYKSSKVIRSAFAITE